MSKFHAKDKKLGTFFNDLKNEKDKKWIVPDYQRDFTWKEEQFKEFWEDFT